MDLIARWRGVARAHPYAVDTLLAVACYLAPLVSSADHRHTVLRPEHSAVLYGIVVFAPLMVRRRWPVQVLVISSLATIGYIVDGHPRGPMLFGPMVAAYTVSVLTERTLSLTCGLLAVAAIGTASLATSPEPWNSEANGVAYAWVGLAVAVGEAVRTRRAFVAAIEERARRAEYTREEEARRRVVEERLRIARELHDIVGHHIALINVQAGVASHVLESQPEQARQALAHVREAGRSALAELGATVSVLRKADEPVAPTEPHEPAPGLARLEELLASFRRVGLEVHSEVTGRLGTLPSTVDLAAYRIVQEALTNVRKHAGASGAVVRLDFRREVLRIEVDDDGPDAGEAPAPPAGGGTGHGIIGMRERAVALGGGFRAGPQAGGGFRVSAELPLGGRRLGAQAGGPGQGPSQGSDQGDHGENTTTGVTAG